MWKPALRSETDPEWKTTSLLAAIKNPLKYRTDYKSSSEPWDNQSFSPGLIQQPLYSSILNNRILSSMQAKATCGHSKVSLLSQEWLIEEFLNSFIDYIRYTPYTYIYTNDWIRNINLAWFSPKIRKLNPKEIS